MMEAGSRVVRGHEAGLQEAGVEAGAGLYEGWPQLEAVDHVDMRAELPGLHVRNVTSSGIKTGAGASQDSPGRQLR